MAQVIRETKITDDNNDINRNMAGSARRTLARVVYLISSVIITVLIIRFVFMLLGANSQNAFADFIYTISRPFVAPFFGLFSYQSRIGISRLEYETLVAIVAYILLTWIIIRALAVREDSEV